MTWLTTWQSPTGTQYAAHETERQAEAHAAELRRERMQACAFWSEGVGDPWM
ncbi:MAG: hypothetical protein AVDCRST_MAG83-1701 [uncultured Arthrobacter sp.]|uniref:Uncharacterized protein n=1 Tax=uncultured Arthrobacter sp. TaxID=114050 RepID=A0A6J4I4A6_9MICC|nr:hypothetical protein [uncultured Arthrobacter sp.]CAA9242286.1 MAG: hypothetical protein AVDCRST_MAG83-1701 [uncultured Arthrobacter sp.]